MHHVVYSVWVVQSYRIVYVFISSFILVDTVYVDEELSSPDCISLMVLNPNRFPNNIFMFYDINLISKSQAVNY